MSKVYTATDSWSGDLPAEAMYTKIDDMTAVFDAYCWTDPGSGMRVAVGRIEQRRNPETGDFYLNVDRIRKQVEGWEARFVPPGGVPGPSNDDSIHKIRLRFVNELMPLVGFHWWCWALTSNWRLVVPWVHALHEPRLPGKNNAVALVVLSGCAKVRVAPWIEPAQPGSLDLELDVRPMSVVWLSPSRTAGAPPFRLSVTASPYALLLKNETDAFGSGSIFSALMGDGK